MILILVMMAKVISMTMIKVIMTLTRQLMTTITTIVMLTRLMMMTSSVEVRANYRCWCPAGITSKK